MNSPNRLMLKLTINEAIHQKELSPAVGIGLRVKNRTQIGYGLTALMAREQIIANDSSDRNSARAFNSVALHFWM
jgi:hypothetical protein